MNPGPPLSARFEEWFKSQPEAQTHTLQALDHTNSDQPSETATVYGVKGPNDHFTPVLYDFDSKYAIEETDTFTAGEPFTIPSASSGATAGHLDKTKDVHINDVSPKARKVLGMDQPATNPPKVIITRTESTNSSLSSPAQQPQTKPEILPPSPAIILLPNKKPWTKTHIRTLMILSLILQAGIIALTISIVLCTQATKNGRTTDGSIITGVIGCASIICGLITGYDMLIAEYAPSQHQHRHPNNSGNDIEKGIFPYKPPTGNATKSQGGSKFQHTFLDKEISIDTHAANTRYYITHRQLPHNVIYNSRLSNPFTHINPLISPTATSLASPRAPFIPFSSPYATSLASPRAPPGEIYTQIRETRPLTPHSPLPYSPTLGSMVPSKQDSGCEKGGMGKSLQVPETWAQRLETRVRPLSKLSSMSRLSPLPEEEDEMLAAGECRIKEGKEGKGEKEGRDSTTSRILSLYSTPRLNDTLYHHDLPLSPVTSSFYELPARESRVSGFRRSSLICHTGRESFPLTLQSSSAFQAEKGKVMAWDAEKGGRRAEVERAWSRAMSAFTSRQSGKGEGGRRERVSWA